MGLVGRNASAVVGKETFDPPWRLYEIPPVKALNTLIAPSPQPAARNWPSSENLQLNTSPVFSLIVIRGISLFFKFDMSFSKSTSFVVSFPSPSIAWRFFSSCNWIRCADKDTGSNEVSASSAWKERRGEDSCVPQRPLDDKHMRCSSLVVCWRYNPRTP